MHLNRVNNKWGAPTGVSVKIGARTRFGGDWIHENPAASNLLSPTNGWHVHGLILIDVAAG